MVKPTEEQCYDVIRFCISYLYDKFANERGLFRSTVSLTDVRLLQSQIVENGPSKYREDLDPHLVAEVLHTSLKDLKPTLLNEVYQDILETGKNNTSINTTEQSHLPCF
ncbi:hypothetical protein EON65_49740 [archaeon]|nr:MAG: hypothetical protein EON65_49740 [archaeon]